MGCYDLIRKAAQLVRPKPAFAVCILGLITLCGCEDLTPSDMQSLLIPRFQHSEVIGFLAGLGTTFAVVPDLVAMLRRRSSAGMNPRMAAIMGIFQIVWVYYGLLIASRPVIAWNLIAFSINFVTVGAFSYFAGKEKGRARPTGDVHHPSSEATRPPAG